jgi:hypothetical protein
MSDSEKLFKELELGFHLVVDNDSCFTYEPDADWPGQITHYNFTPKELVHLFAKVLGPYVIEEV